MAKKIGSITVSTYVLVPRRSPKQERVMKVWSEQMAEMRDWVARQESKGWQVQVVGKPDGLGNLILLRAAIAGK